MFILTFNQSARIALLLGAGLSFATPICAQNAALDAAADNAVTAPLQKALAADNTPLSLQASALDSSWRRFKPGAIMGTDLKSVLSDFPENQSSISYSFVTRGETLSVGSETFLIAYRTRLLPSSDYDAVENLNDESLATNTAIVDQFLPEGLSENPLTSDGYLQILPQQKLRLCLLNVRNVGDLGDIRAFQPQTDLLNIATADNVTKNVNSLIERASLSGQAINNRVSSDLKQIGLGMLQYVQDYDEKLPSMISAQSMAEIKKADGRNWNDSTLTKVQQVLQPYLKNTEIFAHPITRELYRPNLNISRRNLASFDSPEQVVAFYEASPAPDGTRAVLYLDGHVKRELETDWAAIRAASDRFAPPFNASVGYAIVGVGTSTGNASVTLLGSAALAYMYRRGRDDKGRKQTVYLSKNGRIYYRDSQTRQAIWLDAPEGGISLPAAQAREFRNFQGYNAQNSGQIFGLGNTIVVG